MHFAEIILKMQADGRKISTVAGIAPPLTVVEVVPPEAAIVAPVVSKKRGPPPKTKHLEVGTSSDRAISMLGLSLRVAPTMQFDLRPDNEGILVVVPTLDLIKEMVELQCQAAVVSRAIGDELKRVESVVIPMLKVKLEFSALSLKNALEAADKYQEERWRENQIAKEEQEALKATLAKVMAKRDNLTKEKADLTAEKESLNTEIEKYQGFMLRINEESFNQDVLSWCVG